MYKLFKLKEEAIQNKYNYGYLGCIEGNSFNTKFYVYDNGLSKSELYYLPNNVCKERKLLVILFLM